MTGAECRPAHFPSPILIQGSAICASNLELPVLSKVWKLSWTSLWRIEAGQFRQKAAPQKRPRTQDTQSLALTAEDSRSLTRQRVEGGMNRGPVGPALFGQGNGPVVPIEQRRPQLLLHGLDLVADGTGRNAQFMRGQLEAAEPAADLESSQ